MQKKPWEPKYDIGCLLIHRKYGFAWVSHIETGIRDYIYKIEFANRPYETEKKYFESEISGLFRMAV